MEKPLNADDKLNLIMYSEVAYIMHLGKEYEEKILNAQETMNPVITVKNINGCNTSIPLERALKLLEKYYKLINKSAESLEAHEPETTVADDKIVTEKKKKTSEKYMIAGSF